MFQRVEILENQAKLFIKSKGVPLIPTFDRPDSFFYKDIGTRVLTPKVVETYEKQYETNEKIIEGKHEDFKERSLSAIEKAVELREKFWGQAHMLTLNAHLLQLAVLEVIEEDDEDLYERCISWLLFCEKTLNSVGKDKENGISVDGIPQQIMDDVVNQDYSMLLNFYACIVRITSDCLIRLKKAPDAVKLLQVALKEISEHPKEHMVHIILLGRCLANAYVEQGKVEEAITATELLLDLQSQSQYKQDVSKALSVDEWVDPIKERISTSIQLARMKIAVSAFDEAEVLIRAALDIASEHAGKYTALACQIQYELLNLVKQNPAHSDQDFLDLYQISLDIAKETHKRILKDMEVAHGNYDKKALAQTLPYTRLLRLGINLYRFSEEHRDFYLRLVVEAAKSWAKELVTHYSHEYCNFVFTAHEELIKYGRVEKAVEVLQYAHDAFANTHLDPSPVHAKYTTAQVHAQNLIDFGDRAQALPFYKPSLPTGEIDPRNKAIVFDLLNDSLSSVQRWNNNQLHTVNTSPHLYALACTQTLFEMYDDAEKTILKCMAMVDPNFSEKLENIDGTPENVDIAALEPLGNVTVLAASLFEETGQKKRAMKYYQFACRVLRLTQCDTKSLPQDKAMLAPYYLMQEKITRYGLIAECLSRLISIHRGLMKIEPEKYTEKVLSSYKAHHARISAEQQKVIQNEQKCIQALNEIIFKAGDDVIPMLEEILKQTNLLEKE